MKGRVEMLRLFYQIKDLNFGKLMTLYWESNSLNAQELYSDLDRNTAILRAEEDFYRYLQEDFFRIPNAAYAVWEENGVYITALRLEPYQDGLLLEALETHPEYRNKGFAKRLIRGVLQHLEKQGSTVVYSHISKRNTASLKTHLSCGFQRVSEQAVYIDGSVTNRACTMRYAAGR